MPHGGGSRGGGVTRSSGNGTSSSSRGGGGGSHANNSSGGGGGSRSPTVSARNHQVLSRTVRSSEDTTDDSNLRHGGGHRPPTTARRGWWFSRGRRHQQRRHDDVEEPLIPQRRHHDNDEEEEERCARCAGLCMCLSCVGGFLWYCGLCCGKFVKYCCWKPTVAIVTHPSRTYTVPIILTTGLMSCMFLAMSGWSETWIMSAGESRRAVPQGWFINSVEVQVVTQHTTVHIDVYGLSSCPPLTGPVLEITEEHEMAFSPGDFQYDYFFMNQGSRAEVQFSVTQGEEEVYLLRGQDKVDMLQEPHIVDDDKKWHALLDSALQSWSIKDYKRQPTTVRFRSDRNDVYTLLYDNPYNRNGHMYADYWLDLTTYKLDGYYPKCSDIAFARCPPVSSKCVIVDTHAWGKNTNEFVTLRVVGRRNWGVVMGLSFIPVYLGILLGCYKLCCERWCGGRRQRRRPSAPAYEPPTPAETGAAERDPPTNPFGDSAASAPPEDEDDDSEAAAASVPVAKAEVIEEGGESSPTPVVPVEAPADETDDGKKKKTKR